MLIKKQWLKKNTIFFWRLKGAPKTLKRKKKNFFWKGTKKNSKKTRQIFFFQIEGRIRVKKNALQYKRAISKKNKTKKKTLEIHKQKKVLKKHFFFLLNCLFQTFFFILYVLFQHLIFYQEFLILILNFVLKKYILYQNILIFSMFLHITF